MSEKGNVVRVGVLRGRVEKVCYWVCVLIDR